MFSPLNIFKTASALAAHAATRQSVIAENMANADTPGYKAQDITKFDQVFEDPSPSFSLRATRSEHLVSDDQAYEADIRATERPGDESPNGNTVSLETEMVSAAEVKFSHDMALTVYKSSMTLLRSSLGRS